MRSIIIATNISDLGSAQLRLLAKSVHQDLRVIVSYLNESHRLFFFFILVQVNFKGGDFKLLLKAHSYT